ncbi:MAG: glutaredoxin family protein [Actinomycetota bacterium]
MRRRVVLYTTPDCHLCDDAREALRALKVDFEEVDARDDPRRFLRTPVVEVAGNEVAQGEIDRRRLARALGRRRFPWSGR